MELFKEIRLKIGNVKLTGKLARFKRGVSYSNFSKVKTIGVVWDASNTSEFPSLSRFHQKMQDKKIEVTIIGYYPGNNLPDQYTAIRYLRCIKRDEIGAFYYPVSQEAASFINNPFDILIDINFNNHFPLRYIASLSKARFKVGLYDAELKDSLSDMMIEMKKPFGIDDYLDQVLRYLEMIQDKKLKTVE